MSSSKKNPKAAKGPASAKRKAPAKAPADRRRTAKPASAQAARTPPAKKAAGRASTARKPGPARARAARRANDKVRANAAATAAGVPEAGTEQAPAPLSQAPAAPRSDPPVPYGAAPVETAFAGATPAAQPPGEPAAPPRKESLIERSFRPFEQNGAAREPAPEAAAGSDPAQRANKLVPTNAVHTTKRRLRRGSWQNRAIALAALGLIAGLAFLTDRQAPNGPSPFERRSARPITDPVQAAPRRGPALAATADPRGRQVATAAGASDAPDSVEPVPAGGTDVGHDEARTGPYVPSDGATAAADAGGLNRLELIQLERFLGRLELSRSDPDGVIDRETEDAIRTYQQIAGLPIDGEPSRALLDDMREVVSILDGGG